jgi:hypothetical protein
MNLSRDEQMARLSLELDPKERENLLAEHRHWERRRRAMRRGDSGSPIAHHEPIYFPKIACLTCSAILTTQTHGGGQLCHACIAHEAKIQHTAETNARFLLAQAKVVAGQKREARNRLVFWVMTAIGVGLLLTYAADKVLFWLGGNLP